MKRKKGLNWRLTASPTGKTYGLTLQINGKLRVPLKAQILRDLMRICTEFSNNKEVKT
jgi:hypothetical protein